jgi:hypothetical protein
MQGDLARNVGRDLADLLAVAEREQGLVVRSSPVAKLGSYLEETVDLSALAPVLTDTRTVLAFLSSQGRIDAIIADAARAYLEQVDEGWPAPTGIDPGSKLYLDDLTVTYLDHVGLLEPLTRSVAAVFVPHEVGEHAEGILNYAEFTQEVLNSIERMRATLSAALEEGCVGFSARRLTEKEQDEEDILEHYPTIDLLSDLSQADLALADDRCLNKEPFWGDAAQRRVPVGSTLDLLLGLKKAGKLDDAAFWMARHKLRIAGFYAVPLEPEELDHHLGRAIVSDGALRETPELKAIRESLALPKLVDAFMPTEDHWLLTIRHTVFRALRDAWANDPDIAAAQAKADWLLSIWPEPMAWCPDPENETNWATARQQSATQIGLLMVFLGGDQARRDGYFEWLESRVLAPLRTNHPELWDAAIEQSSAEGRARSASLRQGFLR